MSVIDNLLKWNDEYELAGMVIELRGTRDELQAENERLTAEVKRVNAILVDAVEEFDTICKKKDDKLARLRSEREWIPVSERLPEYYDCVLVICDDGYMAKTMRTKKRQRHKKWFSVCGCHPLATPPTAAAGA